MFDRVLFRVMSSAFVLSQISIMEDVHIVSSRRCWCWACLPFWRVRAWYPRGLEPTIRRGYSQFKRKRVIQLPKSHQRILLSKHPIELKIALYMKEVKDTREVLMTLFSISRRWIDRHVEVRLKDWDQKETDSALTSEKKVKTNRGYIWIGLWRYPANDNI